MNNLIETYYRSHRDELLAFVGSRLGGIVEAEDIVQNVFVRLLTTDKMITEVTLPALTYTIARNLISDYYRRRNTYEEFEHYIKRSSDTGSSMESVFSAMELTELMERGLARVPENCREIYRMHIYGGMKVGEISQALGEGYKSVEHRLGAARKALRSFLKNYA
ncbi:MAG: sigma-70 family RNA polymerase sigma factor [Prevotella sp.]|nr:sigma-70 family RNA polymerase sigma factor [Prevotella sp.]